MVTVDTERAELPGLQARAYGKFGNCLPKCSILIALIYGKPKSGGSTDMPAAEPQIGLITRDRGGGYALAAAKALLEAIQVTDPAHH